jgi:putative membrane protein
MVTDHTKSTESVKKGDRRRRPVGPGAARRQEGHDRRLEQRLAADFDKTYLDQQTMAHQDALMLMTAESQSGDVPHLKDAAGKILPVVQMHVDMLAKMTVK